MKPVAIVVALGMAAVGAPLSGATEFVAYGDSVTVGGSWPSGCDICPVEFDCTGGCSTSTSSGREKCGHTRRLDDWIDTWPLGPGPGDHVVNRGKGGEQTAAAVSRLPGVLDLVCATPGDCNAVILMHGTNDMNNRVSPETARDNLGFMIAEAKSRNIDTLLMTIIRKVYVPGNPKWRDYKDLILALAADESLQSVNPWLTLCAGTSCFNNKYWVDHAGSQCTAPGEGDNELGHLDPDGYDDLTDLIKAQFPGSAPAAPVPTVPTGDITDTTPDFVWPEVASARWYVLEVDATTTWWEAAVHCSLGTCTVNPGVALTKSAHSWRVRGRNLRGMGTWSAATPFGVWGIPGTPVGVSPTGSFDDVDPLDPPFAWEPYTWTEAAEATDYDLEVSNGGGPVLMQSFDSSNCVASACTASPSFGLAEDNYTWTVQPRNPASVGTPSSPLAFDVNHLPPAAPTPIAPTGEVFEMAPVYEWLETAGATEYDLQVKNSGGTVVAQASNLLASAVCSAGGCLYLEGTVLIGPDNHTLEVRGRSAGGDGPFSSPGLGFTVLDCGDPSQKDLADFLMSGAVGTPPPLKHCGPLTAAATGSFEIEATGDLTVHTGDGFTAFNGFSVLGELTVKSP